MRIGKHKNDTGNPLATGLRFAKGRLIVELDDEREVSIPLKRYPTLKKATPAKRSAWKLIGPGKGFYWKSLDLDLSVRGLVSGLPEVIPAPPAIAKPTRRKASSKAA